MCKLQKLVDSGDLTLSPGFNFNKGVSQSRDFPDFNVEHVRLGHNGAGDLVALEESQLTRQFGIVFPMYTPKVWSVDAFEQSMYMTLNYELLNAFEDWLSVHSAYFGKIWGTRLGHQYLIRSFWYAAWEHSFRVNVISEQPPFQDYLDFVYASLPEKPLTDKPPY